MFDIRIKKIYMYRFPCGRVYIGQTIQSMKRRWGKQGEGYWRSKKLYAVIQYYLSINPNFKPAVKILARNLTPSEANDLEKYYIKYYREKLGYDMVLNDQDGGVGNTKKVRQYSYDGFVLLNTFDSIEEAAASTGVSADHIGHCIRKPWRNYSAGGYRWYYDDGKHYPLIYFPIDDNTAKPVKQIDLYSRKVIAIYESAHEAARQTGIYRKAIMDCLHHPEYAHTAGGYAWEYDDGKIRPLWYLSRNTRVIQRDANTKEIIGKYNSVKEASIATGINGCGISACMVGRQLTAGGYIFEKENFNVM